MPTTHRARQSLSALLLLTIVAFASSAVSHVVQNHRPTVRVIGEPNLNFANVGVQQFRKYLQRASETLTQKYSVRQDDLASGGNEELGTNTADDRSQDEGVNNTDDGSDGVDGANGIDGTGGSDVSTQSDGSDGSGDLGDDQVTGDHNETSSSTENENVDENPNGSVNEDAEKKDQEISDAASGEEQNGNKTDPFDAFTLIQMVELSSDDGFEQVSIYEHGSFVGPFANSPNTSNVDELSGANDEAWYTDSEYADRIAFQFTYIPDSEYYAISTPNVITGSSSGILPSVEDFTNDPSTGAGSFTVLYRCQRDAPQKSHVSLKLQVTEDRAIETTWTKKCGSGRYERLEFGFTSHNHEVMLFNPDGTYGKDEQKNLEVGPLETSTELTMKLTPPAQNLQFSDPYISSESEDVLVHLRGTISAGTLSSDRSTSFSILYDCKTTITTQIAFTVEIPPWDNVTASWRKDCGGSHSQALLIGTKGSDSYDVMQDGELSGRYNVTEETTLDDAFGIVASIPADDDSQRFFLTNSDDTSELHIQTITTTMSNPEVLGTVVSTPLIGGSYIPSGGDVIRRHETKVLSLHFVCKREGKSLVLITLPTLRYKNIEFGFIKECGEPKVYHHSGFLQTASSLMAAFFVLGVLAAIATCIYVRRRQGTKYSAVPTSEPVIP